MEIGKDKIVVAIGALIVVALVVLLGLSYSSGLFSFGVNTSETVTIGALFPLTGGLANYGEESLKAAQMAVDEINSNGGINGAKLVIDFQDHQCNAAIAKTLFEEEVSVKNIKVFTSLACSGTVLGIASELVNKEAVLLGTAVSTPKLSGVSENFFRNWALDSSEAELFATEALALGVNKVGVIFEETDYAKGMKIVFEEKLKQSGVEVVSESFVSNSTDIRSQISKLKEQDLDAVFISVQTVTSADTVLKQMTELGYKPKQIFGSDYVLKTGEFIKKYSSLLEGTIGADFVYPNTPKYKEYLENFKAKYGSYPLQPNFSAGAYDAVYFLAAAIKEKGYNAKAVADYLSNNSIEGATGTLAFNSMHDRADAVYTPFIVKEGKVVKLMN